MRFATFIGGLFRITAVSAAIRAGPHWPGSKGLQYMFIFGDSYSTVSWSPTTAPTPTPENPIGVQWPGVTSVGFLKPNWVGYMTNGFNRSSLLGFDYAISGNNVIGYISQIQTEFVPTAGQKPPSAPWSADNSVFISWIGINDINNNEDTVTSIRQIMGQQQDLYDLGARNFLFIDVPPWDRSPMGSSMPGLRTRILEWNARLAVSALGFLKTHPDASVLFSSSWNTFTAILNNPAQYNITDPSTVGGGFWIDGVHVSSYIHCIYAHDLANGLNSLPAGPYSTPNSPSDGVQMFSKVMDPTAPLCPTTYPPGSTILHSLSNPPQSSLETKRWYVAWTSMWASLRTFAYRIL